MVRCQIQAFFRGLRILTVKQQWGAVIYPIVSARLAPLGAGSGGVYFSPVEFLVMWRAPLPLRQLPRRPELNWIRFLFDEALQAPLPLPAGDLCVLTEPIICALISVNWCDLANVYGPLLWHRTHGIWTARYSLSQISFWKVVNIASKCFSYIITVLLSRSLYS